MPLSIWRKLSPFDSIPYTQKFLHKCYETEGLSDALAKSYKNSYPMSYYLNHGKKYYTQAKHAPDEIKPVLLFYGMIQLVKACVLTQHTDYPENADVLAHGVSTRKRKKQDYNFFDDTITIQKRGLYSVLTTYLYKMESQEGKKHTMHELFLRIPELAPLFERMNQKHVVYHLKKDGDSFVFSKDILDDLHVTERRLNAYLNTHGIHCVIEDEPLDDQLRIELKDLPTSSNVSPLLCDIEGELYLPYQKELFTPLHEVLVHYLLLYNLSMISRYETEWWNDLFHQKASNALPFIKEFLLITEVKVPFYIMSYLTQKELLVNVHNK